MKCPLYIIDFGARLKIIEIPASDGYENIRIVVKGPLNPYLASMATGGQQEEESFKFFISYLSQNSVKSFMDLGASSGLFSFNAAIRGIKTVAIEMLPSNIEKLSATKDFNKFSNLKIIGVAIGKEVGEVFFTGDAAWGTTNSSSDGQKSIQTTLDKLDIPADLIKIDIEGSELECLQGARKYLKKYSPDLIIELNAAACGNHGYSQREILKELVYQGYNIYRISGEKSLVPWQIDDYQEIIYADYFATKRKRKKLIKALKLEIEVRSQEKSICKFVSQLIHDPLHSWYHLTTLDRVPTAWLGDVRVIEYLNQIEKLSDLEVIRILRIGA